MHTIGRQQLQWAQVARVNDCLWVARAQKKVEDGMWSFFATVTGKKL